MATLYCSSCGTKMEYFSSKPNFCSSCGQPVNIAFAGAKTQKPKKQVVEEIDNEESEIGGEIVKPRLGADIVVGKIEGQSISFGELIKQKPLNAEFNRKTVDTNKKLLDQMRDMCKPTNLGDLSSQVDE